MIGCHGDHVRPGVFDVLFGPPGLEAPFLTVRSFLVAIPLKITNEDFSNIYIYSLLN